MGHPVQRLNCEMFLSAGEYLLLLYTESIHVPVIILKVHLLFIYLRNTDIMFYRVNISTLDKHLRLSLDTT